MNFLNTAATFVNAAIIQGIPLLYGATGEIITEKSGNLNLGIPGIMYVGGISGIIGAYLYEHSVETPAAFWCWDWAVKTAGWKRSAPIWRNTIPHGSALWCARNRRMSRKPL